MRKTDTERREVEDVGRWLTVDSGDYCGPVACAADESAGGSWIKGNSGRQLTLGLGAFRRGWEKSLVFCRCTSNRKQDFAKRVTMDGSMLRTMMMMMEGGLGWFGSSVGGGS